MSANTNEKNKKVSIPGKRKTLLISLGILLGASVITFLIFITEPEAVREGATRKTAMLVEVVPAEKGDFSPVITSTGIVKAEQDIWLQPRISGEIISISDKFYPGEFVKKGMVMLTIDPADYKNALELRKAELAQAEANLELEMGQQYVAKQDYQLLEDSLAIENKSLVLRQPQLNSAKAQVKAAKAAVDRAKLDLERTIIRAPFDAQIISRQVNLGSQVAPGQNLARLVGTDTYWIEASIPPAKTKWLNFHEKMGNYGSSVKITRRSNWGKNQYREGYLQKMIGALEDQTRLARVLITVDDPLLLEPENEKPPLMIGAFMEIQIEGKMIPEVIRLKRSHVRQNNTVWIMQDSVLRIKKVNVITTDENYAYLSEGIKANDKVVITNLSTVVDGEPLRLEQKSNKDTASQTTNKNQH